MRILHSLEALRQVKLPVVAAAGFFDGVHLGHRTVIDSTIARARAIHGEAWLLTFDPHPMRVLNPTAAPPLLTATPHKLRVLERLDLDGCLVLPFTRAFAATEAEDFAAQLIAISPPLTELVVGENWRFGHRGSGHPPLLSQLSEGTPLTVTVAPPMAWEAETISSTRIRSAVQRGNIDEATAMLGRPFSVLGTVEHGEGIGRQLGYPTANLDAHHEVLPPFGIYAARALICRAGEAPEREAQLLDGVVSFGVRPTIETKGKPKPVFELHILDHEQDLYGMDIEIFFVSRLRDEEKFASIDQLKSQIAHDVEDSRRILANHPALP